MDDLTTKIRAMVRAEMALAEAVFTVQRYGSGRHKRELEIAREHHTKALAELDQEIKFLRYPEGHN